MSKHQVLFSVCIPTWNRAQILDEQLSIFVKQISDHSLENKIELVISNNGSEDETEKIVQKYQSHFNFIIYNNNGINKGARFNLLKSLELANGKYLTFLGDDDRYKEGGFKKIINCLESNINLNALFDSQPLKKKPFADNSFISLEQLLQNFYYGIGNAGLFVIKTDLLQANIKKYGYDHFSLSWPQTQLIVLSLHQSENGKILLSQLDLFADSVHDKVMMYNSYYLLRGLYFDLADAIDSIKDNISPEYHFAARSYLRNNVLQNTFNILQCGVFVDDEGQRSNTRAYIRLNKKKYSAYEKIFLNLIVFVLELPQPVSKLLSNIFIFATRGTTGLKKKNRFVKQELEKIAIKKRNSKAIRTFDFNS